MTDRKAKNTADEKAMNGARSQSMKAFGDAYAEPPPYSAEPPSTTTSSANGSGSLAPSREFLTTAQLSFDPSPLEIPTPAECIAHLKLLHAFAKLRHDVGNQDGLFGISMEVSEKADQPRDIVEPLSNGSTQPGGVHNENAAGPETSESTVDASLAERIRDKRWAIFVNKAVARFEKWWDTLPHQSSIWSYGPIREADFDKSSDGYGQVDRFVTDGEGFEAQAGFRLPPLDVLMVWHAFTLNPRNYLEDCIRYTKHTLWRTSFPWKTIHEIIDGESFEYMQKDTTTFPKRTGHPFNPLKDHTLKEITCPKCTSLESVPWTRPPTMFGPDVLESYLAYDTGYSGQHFESICKRCSFKITHETLRVGKFIQDAQALIDERRPLAGTILNLWGEIGVTGTGKKLGSHDAFFPHRAIRTQNNLQPYILRRDIGALSVAALKSRFEAIMKWKTLVKEINKDQSNTELIAKASKIAVRKVLSHYWDNSSIFSIDLVGAVLRQGGFIQKMKKLDWLHSPTVMATTQRLIVKYHRFVRLAADNPYKTVVPTLDVDLAWHTHQLTPKVYYSYTMAEVKKFLNHDDKIPETSLHTNFQWTSQAYEKKYGQPYSECSCWYCECTREPMRSNFLGKLSSRRNSLNVDRLDTKGFPKDPHSGPHVSAHNAFVIDDQRSAARKRQELEELDLQYAKVVKRYQKQRNAAEPPRKDDKDAYYYGAYGYPMYYPMPVYVPYYGDAECQKNTHSGGSGSGGGGCAAGTCCPSTSWGACAGGNGTPGCQASCGGHGGASGGCGTCGGGDGGGGGCGGCGGD